MICRDRRRKTRRKEEVKERRERGTDGRNRERIMKLRVGKVLTGGEGGRGYKPTSLVASCSRSHTVPFLST